MRWLPAGAAVVAGAIGLRLLYGPGTIGYDAIWSLEWGRELVHGSPPDLAAPGAPSPHPLAIAASALLSLLGARALDVTLALSWLAFAVTGAVAFQLGAALYSRAVGALFAALIVTRPLLVLEVRQAIIDIPFLALVLAAMVAAARRPRTDRRTPALLLAAGLLRPEAWLLAAAWFAWAAPALPPRGRWALVAATVAAPVLWIAFDLACTGDPLHSLHGTRALAEQLDRPRTLPSALSATPSYLRFVLTGAPMWLGLSGAAAALLGVYERTLLPAAVAGLGLLAFLALGVSGLPLLARYLLPAAALLALWCAVAALGFTVARPPREGARGAWTVGGVLALVVLAASVPGQVNALRRVRAPVDARAPISDDLVATVGDPRVRAALARCRGMLSVPDDRPRPLAAYALRRAPASIAVARSSGVMLSYATSAAQQAYRIGISAPPGPPPGRRPLVTHGAWTATARC